MKFQPNDRVEVTLTGTVSVWHEQNREDAGYVSVQVEDDYGKTYVRVPLENLKKSVLPMPQGIGAMVRNTLTGYAYIRIGVNAWVAEKTTGLAKPSCLIFKDSDFSKWDTGVYDIISTGS